MTSSIVKKLLTGLITINILLISLLSLVPPISRDALVHHLAIPQLYLAHGKMIELPCMSYSYFPMNLDLLYMIPLAFGNDIVPKFIHFLFALLTGGVIYLYLKKRLNQAYALFGTFLFLSLPIIVKLSITVYVDLGLAFFSFTALILLLEWVDSGFRKKYLLLSGLCCGLAMGTKYNGLITFLLLALFTPFLYARYSPRDRGTSVKALAWGAVFVLVALAAFSPWMARNYTWKGNPIYPLYNQYFTIKNDNPCQAHAGIPYENTLGINVFKKRELLYNESPSDMLLLPVRIFFQGQDNNFQYFDGKLSALLFFLPLALLVPLGRKGPFGHELAALFAFALLFFLIAVFSTSVRIRYFLPSVPCMVVLSVFGLRQINVMASQIRGVGRAAAPFVICAAVAVYMGVSCGGYYIEQFRYVRPFAYLSGNLSGEEYVSSFRNEYPALSYINEHLPEDAVVLFFFNGKRGYYCRRTYVPDEGRSLDLVRHLIRQLGQPEAVRQALKARGITHLLMNHKFVKQRILEDFNTEELKIFLALMRQHTRKLYDRSGYSVYAL